MTPRQINAKQIKKIHALKNQIGMDDDTYRAALNAQYGVQSCKDLTFVHAARFITDLEQKAGLVSGNGRNPPGNSYRRKYENLRERDGMATPRQLRKIEAMWAGVSRAETEEARAAALRHFLKRIVGLEDLRFLESWQVRKVINALEAMEKQKHKEDKN